jgi:RNA polymerase sigma-70 factor (ECF subfamily)
MTAPTTDTEQSPGCGQSPHPGRRSDQGSRSIALPGTDRDLAPRISSGEPMAFTELYELMGERLFRFANRMLRDRGAAEDAVQHSFLELVKARPRLQSDRSLEAWMFKSVRFTCLDEIRRRTRRPEVPSDRLPDHGEEDLLVLIDPDLERALAALTPEQQEVLHLKHVEGYDGEEIAEIVDSNRTAVYAMAARAESRLRKLLDPVESAHDPASSPERPT